MIDYRNKPWWLLMAVPIVINCCIGLSYQTMGVYLSAYVMGNLGATATQFGLVSTIWTVVACIMRPASGPLAQKFGTKTIMLIGLVVWTAMIVAFGFVPTFAVWAVCRVIQCFGHATSYTLSQAMWVSHRYWPWSSAPPSAWPSSATTSGSDSSC